MSTFGVVLDANVLFNAPVRDTLLRAAEAGLYRVHWSQTILDETVKNLIDRDRMDEAKANKFITALINAFPEAMTDVPQEQVSAMKNNEKDRHVAACAVCASAQVITTFNLKDFENLDAWNIEPQHPDTQLCYLDNLNPDVLMSILIEQAQDLRDFNLDKLLSVLKKHVPVFVENVENRLN